MTLAIEDDILLLIYEGGARWLPSVSLSVVSYENHRSLCLLWPRVQDKFYKARVVKE